VAAWLEHAPDTVSVMARPFEAQGAPRGPAFEVASSYSWGPGAYYHDRVAQPVLSSNAGGEFVIVWERDTYDEILEGDFNHRIAARIYDAATDWLGDEFLVNETTTARAMRPSIARNSRGDFAVVWAEQSFVVGRPFDASGIPRAGQNRVSQPPPLGSAATVGIDDGGAWTMARASPRGRGFDRAGHPMTDEFPLNSYATTVTQSGPRIAMNRSGDFVVAWTAPGVDGSGYGVVARPFTTAAGIHGDDFETGTFASWGPRTSPDGGDLAVTDGAALAGSNHGLQVTVNDRHGVYVQDERPNLERRYVARFFLDPNGFDPGEAMQRFRTQVFLAFSEEPLKRLIHVVLRRIVGAYSVRVRVREDDDSHADTAFVPITDAPHLIQIDWTRGSAPGANDGTLVFSIDGVVIDTLAELDNDARGIDFVRLGAMSVKAGASGTIFFDEFSSWRRTP
jgi:hypothetical protein